jgi:hypothetical protein
MAGAQMAGRAALALLALLALAACHKRAPADADAASSRGLQVEAYDPVIPKAPLKGKLETLAQHPEDRAATASAPSDAPADSSLASKP